jgi:hypothetical protein
MTSQQMATPINNLPLKTTPPDQSEIDDPLIQNVLKEFEDEMALSKQQMQPQIQQVQQQQPQQMQYNTNEQQLPYQQQFQQYAQHQQGKNKKKLINIDDIQKTAIIAIIVFLLQNYNIVNIIISKLPETISSYTNGKEFIINFVLIFCIFYALLYFDFL